MIDLPLLPGPRMAPAIPRRRPRMLPTAADEFFQTVTTIGLRIARRGVEITDDQRRTRAKPVGFAKEAS